jgi:hypothetical protein
MNDFPAYSSRMAVDDHASAQAYLQGLPWPQTIHGRSAKLPASIPKDLSRCYDVVEQWVATDVWRSEFPGKELYRALRDYVYHNPKDNTPDISLAKSVAYAQIKASKIPHELITLRTVLRNRAGI